MSEIKNEVSIPMGKTAFILWREIDAAVNRWAKDYFGPHVYAEGTRENEDFEVSLRGLTSSDYEKFSELFKRYDLEQDYDPEYEFETGDVTCTLPYNVSRGAVLEALPGEAVRAIGTAIAVYDGVFFMEHSIAGKITERFVAPSQKGHAATSLHEQPQPAASRLEGLRNYKENAAILERAEAEKKQTKMDGLVAKIKALKPRIEELIATGNACLASNIPMTASWDKPYATYEDHAFYTNGISHRLGFAGKNQPSIEFLGVNGGGACGEYDLRTDGTQVFFVSEKGRLDAAANVNGDAFWLMERFLESFDEFETSLYAYVDKLVARQQKSVDELIQSASSRVVERQSASKIKPLDPER